MKDDEPSPVQHHLVLHRIDPGQGTWRFYSLMIERDLFETGRPVRNWGRIGTKGQELVEIHEDEITAGQVPEAVARAKRRRGYQDLQSPTIGPIGRVADGAWLNRTCNLSMRRLRRRLNWPIR
jgi:predicted DNA-binding WGR domain protein